MRTFLVPTGTAWSFNTYPNTDLYGGDLFSPEGVFQTGNAVYQPSADACANFCAVTPGCIGYSWSTAGDGSCWVKEGPWDTQLNFARISGTMVFDGMQGKNNVLLFIKKFYLIFTFFLILVHSKGTIFTENSKKWSKIIWKFDKFRDFNNFVNFEKKNSSFSIFLLWLCMF